MLDLFFNKIVGLGSATLLKKTLAKIFFCEFCGIYKNTFFYKIKLTDIPKPATLPTRTPCFVFSSDFCAIFENSYSQEHLYDDLQQNF